MAFSGRSTVSNVAELIAAFKSCKDDVFADDAKTGERLKVIDIVDDPNIVSERREPIHFVVKLEGARERCFVADQLGEPDGMGGFFSKITIHKPHVEGTEVTKIEIYEEGSKFHWSEGGHVFGPRLTLTLVHTGAEERNAPRLKAHEVEAERQREEERRQRDEAYAVEAAAYKASQDEHYRQYRECAVLPFLELLKGRSIEDITMEQGMLTIVVTGAEPIRICVRSIGEITRSGSIVERPEIFAQCGTHDLSGSASFYFKP